MKIDRIIKTVYKLTDDRLETKFCIIIFFNLQKKIFDKYFIYFFIYLLFFLSPEFSLTPNLEYFTPVFFVSDSIVLQSQLKSIVKLQLFLKDNIFTPFSKS